MIGQVTFLDVATPHQRGDGAPTPGPQTARLNEDGTWESQNHRVAEFLGFFYDPRRESSPCRGPFGVQMLLLAAMALDGEAAFPDGRPVPAAPADVRERIF